MEQAKGQAGSAVPMDPDIQEFVTAIQRGYAEFSAPGDTALDRSRSAAEHVRKPWVRGGPEMERVTDHQVPYDNGSFRIRLFEPTLETDQPALLYIHGGGWSVFSLDTHDRMMREYAGRAGIKVIGIDYNLAPEFKFPYQLHQIVAVVGWLQSHGKTLGIDTGRLAIGGDSAGGNLAVTACLQMREEGSLANIRGMLLNYGAFQFGQTSRSYSLYGGDDYPLTAEEMDYFWRNYLSDETDQTNPLACPLNANVEGLPPAFLAIAECDILYDENIAMTEKFRAAGVPVEAVVYPGTTHSFLEAVSIAQVSDQAFADAATWLSGILTK